MSRPEIPGVPKRMISIEDGTKSRLQKLPTVPKPQYTLTSTSASAIAPRSIRCVCYAVNQARTLVPTLITLSMKSRAPGQSRRRVFGRSHCQCCDNHSHQPFKGEVRATLTESVGSLGRTVMIEFGLGGDDGNDDAARAVEPVSSAPRSRARKEMPHCDTDSHKFGNAAFGVVRRRSTWLGSVKQTGINRADDRCLLFLLP
jgi:hypothetical protein